MPECQAIPAFHRAHGRRIYQQGLQAGKKSTQLVLMSTNVEDFKISMLAPGFRNDLL